LVIPCTASDGIQEIEVTDDSTRIFCTSAATFAIALPDVDGARASDFGDARHPVSWCPPPYA
jgi:hypothetical protein